VPPGVGEGQGLGPVATDLAVAALALARRFAAGGTLWAWCPLDPAHASHVAVEFVHPVIVGKRALPAVAVADGDAVGALRPLARPGDVLLALAPAGHPRLVATLRRATAWGLTTAWLGAGERPTEGAADHVLVLPGDPVLSRHDGRLVLGYHLLWELTHVCFEHPGLLEEREDDPCAVGGRCTTCADEGVLAEVVAPSDGFAATEVRTATGVEAVDTTVLGRVGPGDLLLVHAGTAIALVEPAS
jgi:hypothetical protein